jgi:hypothetical protein
LNCSAQRLLEIEYEEEVEHVEMNLPLVSHRKYVVMSTAGRAGSALAAPEEVGGLEV